MEQRRQAMLQLHLSDQVSLLPTKVHLIFRQSNVDSFAEDCGKSSALEMA